MSDAGRPLAVVGICGSLRAGSYNRRLLTAAADLAPSRLSVVVHEIGDLPMYDAGLDGEAPPEPVVALKAAIAAADGVLFASPEYNYGLTGATKNAIDWVSRPAYGSPLRDKAVTGIATAFGPYGGVRSLLQLKTVLLGCGAAVLPWPDFAVPHAAEKFDERTLVDEGLGAFLAAQMSAFADWIDAIAGYGFNGRRS